MSDTTPSLADQAAQFQQMRDSRAAIVDSGQAYDIAEVGDGKVEGGAFRRKPWHFAMTDSQVTDKLMTIQDIQFAYPKVLSPTVKEPLYLKDGTETRFTAVVRTIDRQALGVVSDRYGDFQNEALAQLAVDVVDEAGGCIETAVSTHNGARVFFVIRVPKEIKIAGVEDQTLQMFVIASNSHDGSAKLRIFPSPVCAECDNTYRLALRFAQGSVTGMYEVKHTSSITARVNEVRSALGISFKYADALNYMATDMAAKPVTDADFQAFLDKLTPVPDKDKAPRAHTNAVNRRATITSIYRDTPYLADVKGTAWGVFQAVSEFADHHSQFKNTKAATADESRFQTLIDGHELPQRALALLR